MSVLQFINNRETRKKIAKTVVGQPFFFRPNSIWEKDCTCDTVQSWLTVK